MLIGLALATLGCTGLTHHGGVASDAPAGSAEPQALRLGQPKAVHRATVLSDGRVLVTGGCTRPGCGGFAAARRSELFDPATGRFTTGATMATARASGTATLLRDGRVLLTGGYPGEGQSPTSSAEVFDPETSAFESVGSLLVARADHSATLLLDGRVLLAGGFGADGRALSSTEIFDPADDTFAAAAPLSEPRADHVAVRVHRQVVLVGGTVSGTAMRSTDVLRGGTWSPGPELRQGRVKLAAVTLSSGQVFVVGGATSTEGRRKLPTTELFALAGASAVPGPRMGEGEYKLDGAVATMPDGRVVIAGGSRLEIYDPLDDTMTRLQRPVLVSRSFLTANVVGAGTLLIAGGYDDQIVPTDQARLVTVPARPR